MELFYILIIIGAGFVMYNYNTDLFIPYHTKIVYNVAMVIGIFSLLFAASQ